MTYSWCHDCPRSFDLPACVHCQFIRSEILKETKRSHLCKHTARAGLEPYWSGVCLNVLALMRRSEVDAQKTTCLPGMSGVNAEGGGRVAAPCLPGMSGVNAGGGGGHCWPLWTLVFAGLP